MKREAQRRTTQTRTFRSDEERPEYQNGMIRNQKNTVGPEKGQLSDGPESSDPGATSIRYLSSG
jgi:hypothetical protein